MLKQSDVFENGIPRFMEHLCENDEIDAAKELCHNDGERALLEIEYGDDEIAREIAIERLYDCEVTGWELFEDLLYVEVAHGEFEGYHSLKHPWEESSHIHEEGSYTWYPLSIEFEATIPDHEVHDNAERVLYERVEGESYHDAARAHWQKSRL